MYYQSFKSFTCLLKCAFLLDEVRFVTWWQLHSEGFTSFSPAVRRWQFLSRIGLFEAFIDEALESLCVSGLSLFVTPVIKAFVNGITVCGQLEVSKFWSVLTKKNKLEELQINTHVGDFPYILFVSSLFLFLLELHPKWHCFAFQVIALKKERPPLPKNSAKAII